MAKYRIISLDGGGIFGVTSIVLLKRLALEFPDLIETTDLIAGTSIGGIIAMGIASGMSPKEIQDVFVKWAPLVFQRNWLRLIGWYSGINAKYENKNLQAFMQDVFKDQTLNQFNKKILIPAFSLKSTLTSQGEDFPAWRAKFFHNFPGDDSDGSEKAADVALYTSSAPTFFAPLLPYIDGGIAANNPALSAICQTQDLRIEINPRPKLSDITVLSFGRETAKNFIDSCDNCDWGWIRWGLSLVKMFLDNDNRVVSYQCKKIINERYVRVAPVLKGDLDSKIDAVEQMYALIDFAEKVDISNSIEKLRKVWY
jgi:patatin-like phospholipase/acyl hydrolase